MSLYSKYRPQNFANLVGQDHIRQTILHEIGQDTVAHAYLFAGPRGTGKTSTARLIAKAVNCLRRNEEGEPCDECEFCKTIAEGSLIDVIEIDAASNRGIDEIRDLKEKINFAPTRAKSKTYIIDEVHMLTKEAFNALLKTLEEPPTNVYFILCTTEIHKIPETIISRCQRFDFKRIDAKTIMTRLSYIAQLEKIETEDAAIELIAQHVEGGLRDAIGLFEQMTIDNKLLADHVRSHLGITGHSTVTTLLDLLEKKDVSKALHLIQEVHNEGYDLTAFVREILECLRERLITGIQQGQPHHELWLSMIMRFEEARDMLRTTVIPELPLEIAVIHICGETIGTAVAPVSVEEKEEKEEEKIEEKIEIPSPGSKEEEATLTKEEAETAKTLKKTYEAEQFEGGDIVAHWPRVLEHVQPPSLRRSLIDAAVAMKDETTVLLAFRSKFHREKVNLVENQAKIEKIIQHLFSKTVKVVCEETMNPSLESMTAEPSSPMRVKKTTEKKASKIDIAAKAMEIFGSEEI